MENQTTIIEINGIKMEVDLRHAKIVHQNVRVGTKVKILAKGSYGGPEVYPAVVVGFEPFTDLPTIIVAYIKASYGNAELQFAYINSKSADKWDLVPSVDDELPINKADVLTIFNRDITKKENEIADIAAKRDFFLKHFDKYFVQADETA
jgi:hypothetical protein